MRLNIKNLAKLILFLGGILQLLGLPTPTIKTAHGSELICVSTPKNQRYQDKDHWISEYIRSRLEAYLRSHHGWQFQSLEAQRLWRVYAREGDWVSQRNSVLITGGFQQVFHKGFLWFFVKYRGETGFRTKRFESFFDEKSFEQIIDQLGFTIGRWIDPEFKAVPLTQFPPFDAQQHENIFLLRQQLLAINPAITEPLLKAVESTITENSDPNETQDFALAQLLYLQKFPLEDQLKRLSTTERLLRRAVFIHRNHGGLHSVLATVYLLSNSFPAWIEKTAKDAIRFDNAQELGQLILSINQEGKSKEGDEALIGAVLVNPWIWKPFEGESVFYLNGMLNTQLKPLHKQWKELAVF